MSGAMYNDDQPRASTSKEGGEPRVSLSTTIHQDAFAAERPPVAIPTELRRRITGTPSRDHDDNVLAASSSSLAKLQTYLPTGTWVTYTALETWAFSLRPNDPPISSTINCNSHQRIALIIILCLSTLLAFLSSFVKRFVYDTEGVHVLYPPPALFSVAHHMTDPLTGVRFPCRTKEKRYCWPLVNDMGELAYDEKGLRVLVFKLGIKIHVRRKIWPRRVWNSWFYPREEVLEAPRLCMSPVSKHMSMTSTLARVDGRDVAMEIDDVLATAPTLEPRWAHTVVGASGSKAYLDFHLCVWAHALVSVLAFWTLAFFSTQVSNCLLPSIPDYLPCTLQTGMLIILGFIAAVFLHDHAVSLGQTAPRPLRLGGRGEAEEVPEYLRAVVEMLVWVRRQDGFSGVRVR